MHDLRLSISRVVVTADTHIHCRKTAALTPYLNNSSSGHLFFPECLIGVLVHWMQAAEIWEELGDWITTNKPELGPGTKERFQMASQLQPEEVLLCGCPECTDLYIVSFVYH